MSMHKVIEVKNLNKTFLTKQTEPGICGALKSLFSGAKKEVAAVENLSFSIQKGERIAFIGPNGAGKSTTIKMLTGILHPTSGHIQVLGLNPSRDRRILGYKIGTVFGQRTQLWYHLPPLDTFSLLSKVYEIDPITYQKRLRELIDLFDLSPFMHKLVRQLSLGERMRSEIVASLLHNPEIVFLDEPTIGLDINAKLTIRKLLHQLSLEFGMTLFVTSHDMADIEQVCDRVIVIDKGTIVLDSQVKELKKNYIKTKKLTLITEEEQLSFHLPTLKVIQNAHYTFICEVDVSQCPIEQVIHKVLEKTTIKDLTIEDPPMEEIIRKVYSGNING